MFHNRLEDLCSDTFDYCLMFGKGWPILSSNNFKNEGEILFFVFGSLQTKLQNFCSDLHVLYLINWYKFWTPCRIAIAIWFYMDLNTDLNTIKVTCTIAISKGKSSVNTECPWRFPSEWSFSTSAKVPIFP